MFGHFKLSSTCVQYFQKRSTEMPPRIIIASSLHVFLRLLFFNILLQVSTNEIDTPPPQHSLTPVYIDYLRTMEDNVIPQLLSSYTQELQDRLIKIREYSADYEEQKRTSTQPGQLNPLASFRLLRRLERLSSSLTADTELDIGLIQGLALPEDVKYTMMSLLRLQHTYDLNPFDLAEGVISGVPTGVKLSAEQCLEIAKLAQHNGYSSLALEWLQISYQLDKMENNSRQDELEVVAQLTMDEHDWDHKFKRDKGHMFLYLESFASANISAKQVLGLTPSTMPFSTVLRNEMNKTVNGNVKQSPFDTMSLCQGYDYQNDKVKAKLKCWYDSSPHPYFSIAPLQVEEIGPGLTMFHSLITERQISQITEIAMSKILPKTDDVDNPLGRDGNVITFSFLENNGTVSMAIKRKAELMLGLNVLGINASEDIRVALYSSGGGMKVHNDAYGDIDETDPYKNYDKTEYSDRLATLLIYLTDIEIGGSTAFPNLGVAIKPSRGSAMYWHSYASNGEDLDWSIMHSGCPVLLGTKLYATLWIKKDSNMLMSKCPAHRKQPHF